MARGTLTVTHLTRAGIAPPVQQASNATDKHQFSNDEHTFVEIENADAGEQTVGFTLSTQAAAHVDGITMPDKTVTLGAGAIKLAGPFPANLYNQTGNVVYVNPSVGTNLKFRVYSIA